MRLFTGLAVPPHATAALTSLMQQLRPLADLRWTRPEKLHVTLTYIGEWPEARLGEIHTALRAVRSQRPVPVAVKGMGWMPNPRFPRALYAGVAAAPQLQALAAATAVAVTALGVALQDRVYRPHLTLARVRGRPPLENLKLHADPITSFEATSFCLYLSSEGKYTQLEEFSF